MHPLESLPIPLVRGQTAVLTPRYSYGAVLLAAAAGLLPSAWTTWLLGPALVVGGVLLGVAHGACDQFVLPATHPAIARNRRGYWGRFLAGYLGLAGAVGLLWWAQPSLAVTLFFGLTAWHWGSADAPASAGRRFQWLAHSLLRGALLFAVPLWHWPAETLGIVNGLLGLTGAAPVAPTAAVPVAAGLGALVVGGHGLLWAYCLGSGQGALVRTDVLEVGLLTALLLLLPPVLSAGSYFVFWHSLQHVLRMNALLRNSDDAGPLLLGTDLLLFLRRSTPLLLLSVAALAGLFGWSWVQVGSGAALLSWALLAASMVTLPHALLVTLGLDAARWCRNPRELPTDK